jgi:hypothetical protein
MIEWYPEKREDLFLRAAATYQDDSLLLGGTYFWPAMSTGGFLAATALTSAIIRRPVFAGKSKQRNGGPTSVVDWWSFSWAVL